MRELNISFSFAQDIVCAVVDDDDAPKMEFIKFDFFMLSYIILVKFFSCFYGARPSIS